MTVRNGLEWKSDNYGIKEITSIQTGRRGGDVERADPTSTWGWRKLQERHVVSEESQPHNRTPSPGFQGQEGKSPQLLAAKTSGDSVGGKNCWSPKHSH